MNINITILIILIFLILTHLTIETLQIQSILLLLILFILRLLLLQLSKFDLQSTNIVLYLLVLLFEITYLFYFVDLLSHFPDLFLDRLQFACQFVLCVVQLACFLVLGLDVLFDLGHEVDARQPILMNDVLNAEEDDLIGSLRQVLPHLQHFVQFLVEVRLEALIQVEFDNVV